VVASVPTIVVAVAPVSVVLVVGPPVSVTTASVVPGVPAVVPEVGVSVAVPSLSLVDVDGRVVGEPVVGAVALAPVPSPL
jgi:hypothetical protein